MILHQTAPSGDFLPLLPDRRVARRNLLRSCRRRDRHRHTIGWPLFALSETFGIIADRAHSGRLVERPARAVGTQFLLFSNTNLLVKTHECKKVYILFSVNPHPDIKTRFSSSSCNWSEMGRHIGRTLSAQVKENYKCGTTDGLKCYLVPCWLHEPIGPDQCHLQNGVDHNLNALQSH